MTKKTIATDLIGAFVFKDHGDGCLSCKWINNGINYPLMECSLRQSDRQKDPYSGVYLTTWIEDPNTEQSHLEISKKDASYNLTWYGPSKKQIFYGKGMLYDGLLVGAYWSA